MLQRRYALLSHTFRTVSISNTGTLRPRIPSHGL
jgi:hypothetical protein